MLRGQLFFHILGHLLLYYDAFYVGNTGASIHMFRLLIGKTMEVYMDDILTKSSRAKDNVGDLKKTFDILQKYKMKLYPWKCAFRVSSGKFFSFIVTKKGIKTNLEKI